MPGAVAAAAAANKSRQRAEYSSWFILYMTVHRATLLPGVKAGASLYNPLQHISNIRHSRSLCIML
jgi:hypothetical protein